MNTKQAAVRRQRGQKSVLLQSKLKKHLLESWQWYILLIPAVIYLIIFDYVPMYGVQIAFKNYRTSKGITGSEWVGFKHFERFINYPNFGKMIKNTLSITLYSVLTFPLPVVFALLINEVRNMKFKKSVQMVTYMPHFLSEVVVCSLVILFLDRTSGPITNLVVALGGERTNLMTNPDAFADIYVWSGVWKNLGWNSILYISALSAVPQEEVEAATIDGANRLQVMLHVNIPHILPTVAITLIMNCGGMLSVGFNKIFLLQNDLNLTASSVISTYVYEMGMLNGQWSYASAVGLFNNVVNVIVLMIVNWIVKKLSGTGLV